MNDQQDDRFDAFLRNTARDYNPPPPTPRDEMWTSIVAGRRARAVETKVRRRWIQWSVGIAAVLVLGVGIGRMTAPGPSRRIPTLEYGVAGPAATYQAVAGDHFGRVETLLTMFRAEVVHGRPDQNVSRTARGLLTTNRLLLDSPVASDPRLRQLLEDLELVLAQIAQLSAEKGMDPSEMIVRALEDNGVLMRLRSAAPAGTGALGTQGAL
jgi:hypothetical protein